MLEWLISWAEINKNIRGLILSGSKANPFDKTDFLSDYDIAVIGSGLDFIENDNWLTDLKKYWVCVHDKFELAGFEIPTRLVIFNDVLKVDFSFLPTEAITRFIAAKELPDGFNIGYKILLDKEGLLQSLPTPTGAGFEIDRPAETEYLRNQSEFWFEVYHVAKYLARNDLWAAKSRDWSAKKSFTSDDAMAQSVQMSMES
jgi:aminoglycoside 6-adenylyltransferase